MFISYFQVIPFAVLREAQNLLHDAGYFSMRPNRIQNLISVTQSLEIIQLPGIQLRHVTLHIQATYLRV